VSELATGEQKNSRQVELNLYTGEEYFKAITADIAQTLPGDRIAITTFCFEPADRLVEPAFNELLAAADRGVDTAFGVDAYTFIIDYEAKSLGPLYLPLPFRQSSFKRRRTALEELAAKPTAICTILNKTQQLPQRLFKNPLAGRSHLKTAVINDKVYIGGPNFHRTDRLDMVVGLEDTETADWLYGLTTRIIEAESTAAVLGDQDQTRQVDGTTQILIDAGAPGQSLILDEAYKVIDGASTHLYVPFQYFPDHETASHIAAAYSREVKVYPAYNHPAKNGIIVGFMQQRAVSRMRKILPPEFFEGELSRSAPILHTKAIASDRAAMVGAHNHANHGPKLGTAESELRSSDPNFARMVGQKILKQIERYKEPIVS